MPQPTKKTAESFSGEDDRSVFMEDFGKELLQNPETKKPVQYSTALADPKHPAHAKAEQAYQQWKNKHKEKDEKIHVESKKIADAIKKERPEIHALFVKTLTEKNVVTVSRIYDSLLIGQSQDVSNKAVNTLLSDRAEIRGLKNKAAEASDALHGPLASGMRKTVRAMGKEFHKAGTALGKMKAVQGVLGAGTAAVLGAFIPGVGPLLAGTSVLLGVSAAKKRAAAVHEIAAHVATEWLQEEKGSRFESGYTPGKKKAAGAKKDAEKAAGFLADMCSSVSSYDMTLLRKHMDKEGTIDEKALMKEMDSHFDKLVEILPDVKKLLEKKGKNQKKAGDRPMSSVMTPVQRIAALHLMAESSKELFYKDMGDSKVQGFDVQYSTALSDVDHPAHEKAKNVYREWSAKKQPAEGAEKPQSTEQKHSQVKDALKNFNDNEKVKKTKGKLKEWLGKADSYIDKTWNSGGWGKAGIVGAGVALTGAALSAVPMALLGGAVGGAGLFVTHFSDPPKKTPPAGQKKAAEKPKYRLNLNEEDLKKLDGAGKDKDKLSEVLFGILKSKLEASKEQLEKEMGKEKAKKAAMHIASTSVSLRSALIKLAYSQPETREAVLPLLAMKTAKVCLVAEDKAEKDFLQQKLQGTDIQIGTAYRDKDHPHHQKAVQVHTKWTEKHQNKKITPEQVKKASICHQRKSNRACSWK